MGKAGLVYHFALEATQASRSCVTDEGLMVCPKISASIVDRGEGPLRCRRESADHEQVLRAWI